MKFFRKIFKTIILVVVFSLGISQSASSQVVGDLGATSSGNWSSAATWSTYTGAAWGPPGVSGIPTAAKNVFILTGNTVTVTVQSACLNLTVQPAAKLWTNSAGNIYLYVYGTSLVCDGQIGNGAIFDGISFGIEGANCTISGIGTFDASRMRKNTAIATTTNLIIARDINLRWNAATTTQLYNAATLTKFNLTINVGATVNLIPSGPSTGNVCIDGLDGAVALAVEAGGTFTVNGTLIISGKLYLTTNNTNPLYSCNWIINGLVRTYEIVAAGSGAAKHSFLINAGGKLDITGTPAWSILDTVKNTFSFITGSTVEYSALGPQAVRIRTEFATVITVNQEYGYLILSGSGLKSTTGDLYIKNDLTITGSAVLDPNPAICNIFLSGNWIDYNNAGFDEKVTTVWIRGGALQTITCPGGEVFCNLKLSKLAVSALQFNDNVDVITQLAFVANCYVDLNSNTLTVQTSSLTGIQGGSNTRYIVSEKMDNSSKIVWKINAGTGIYTYPFGLPPGGAANYFPFIIHKLSAASVGDLTVSTYGTPPNNFLWPTTPTNVTNLQSDIYFHNVPDNRHWTVDRFWEVRATTPTTLDTVKFSYRPVELPDSDATPGNLGAQFWNGAISYWNRTQYGTGSSFVVSVPAFNVFNTSWTLTSLTSPLPIKLLSFDAIPEEDRVKLNWATASEINNDYFTIEKSVDGNEFFPIGEVAGAHNSTIKHEYNLDDPEPFYGISYYRLKQTDYDGMFTYSGVIPVNYKKHNTTYTIFPNPVNDNAWLIADAGMQYEINIRNIEGKLEKSLDIARSSQLIQLDISDLAKGIYFIEVKTNYDAQFLRLVKQ